MAYIRQDDDEQNKDENTQPLAPGAIGSNGFTPSTSQGYFQPQQQTPQQKAGSGTFTNLSSWLDAGKGRDQNISSQGSDLLGKETTKFNTAAQPLRDATDQSTTLSDQGIKDVFNTASGNPIVHGGGINSQIIYNNDPAASSKAFQQLQGLLTQTYNGPTSVDYDPTTGDSMTNLRGLDALSGTNTAGAQLAGEQLYSAGDRRLDNAVFGADAASQKAIAANKKGGTDFLNNVGTETQALNAKAKTLADDYTNAANTARTQLAALGTKITGDVDSRVQTANAQEAAQSDPNYVNATHMVNTPGDRWAGYEPGSGPATEGNQISAGESRGLDVLKNLIGTKSIAQAGTYTPGHWAEEQDPNQAPDLTIKRPTYHYAPLVQPNAGANEANGVGQVLSGIFSGGIGNLIGLIKGAQDPDSQTNQGIPHGQWLDDNGNPVDAYHYDPGTGIVTDVQTGEKFNKSDIDAGIWVIDPKTGKYKLSKQINGKDVT